MPIVESSKKFLFCIAKPWKKEEPDNLCIYAYGTQVHYGTMENAEGLLEYVHGQGNTDYKIYRLTPEAQP